ncbi:MAG: hypothetical protein ABR512_07795 [Desulfopila sp.]
MFHRKWTFIAATLGLWVCLLVLAACSGDSTDENATSAKEATTTPSASESKTGAAVPIVPSGWKTVSDGHWRLSVPEDWVDDAGFYYPEGAVSSMTGAPNVFCVISARTIAEGKTQDDELKAMFGSNPLTKTPITVCNADGFRVEGQNSFALIFEDEALTSSGPMPGIEYIHCRAPSSSFSQYETIFRHILESADCSTD